MDAAGRDRHIEDDEALLQGGIDPSSDDPRHAAAMARRLHALLESAKHDCSVDAPVGFLYAKAEESIARLTGLRLACRKGCAHCCHVWVSATAPEILFLAKHVRGRGLGAREAVHATHALTGKYSFSIRALHPTPCPILAEDACTQYEHRPMSCRFAASPDDFACRRVMREFSRENLPLSLRHLRGRGIYEVAHAIALHRAGLPHYHYELNAGLSLALEREDAESAWLAGEDVFAGCQRDPREVFAGRGVQELTKLAFG
jgi:Putative zinc- or iron-chelating domain